MDKKQSIKDHLPEVEENIIVDGKHIRSKGVYFLPNIITSLALFSAFFSIISSLQDNYIMAAVAIIFSMVFDSMDGRVARMTNTQSAFGEQFDSMSDLVAFGVAPAILAYQWLLMDLGKFGLMATFLYILAAALRLARFNTNIDVDDKKYFTGVSSPVANSMILALVLNFHTYDSSSIVLQLVMAFMVIFAAVLMVSNVKFYSFKDVFNDSKLPFTHLLLAVFYIALLVAFFKEVFLLSCYSYIVIGLFITFKDIVSCNLKGKAQAKK